MKAFQNILANIIKKRAPHEENIKRDKFSPLILSVRKKEGSEKAVEIMERLFRLTNDPYTAQQIARFYIDCKVFHNAKIYAEEATTILPSNSSLMNTYAQVYKVQLLEKVQGKTVLPEAQVTESEFKDLIALCMQCTTLFQTEQSLSELGSFNSDEPGYFGELESIELILKAFQKCRCFGSKSMAKDILHNYLVNESYAHERLRFLSPEENHFLKSLWINSRQVISILDDKYLQMKQEIAINPLSAMNESKKKLYSFKTCLSEFFGEHSDKIPSNLNEEDGCRYRSRLVFAKKASSLSDALDLKHTQKIDELRKCYSLLLKNVQSPFANLGDFKTMLDIATVLLLDGPIPVGLRFEDIIRWTKQFYQSSWKENDKPHLEAFMYFFLYNFPTEERQRFPSLARAPDLPSVLESWKETFNKSKRRFHTITHRETTLFFLGKGQPLQDIVYQQKLHSFIADKRSKFTWDSQRICDILRPMEGILMPGGDYINFIDKRSKTDHEIKIKTSHKINKDVMWRKKIYFYLGFSFSGLKAYGMTDKNPAMK